MRLPRLSVPSGFRDIHHYTKMTVYLQQGEPVKMEYCPCPPWPKTFKDSFAVREIITLFAPFAFLSALFPQSTRSNSFVNGLAFCSLAYPITFLDVFTGIVLHLCSVSLYSTNSPFTFVLLLFLGLLLLLMLLPFFCPSLCCCSLWLAFCLLQSICPG